MVKAHCFKEQKKVDVKNPEYGLNSNGRPFVKGTCSSCGGKVQALIKADDAPPEIRAKMSARKSAKKGSGQTRRSAKHSGKKSAKRSGKRSAKK